MGLFFSFRSTISCLSLSFRPGDLNLICDLSQRNILCVLRPLLTSLSYQLFSPQIYYLRGKTLLSLYKNYSNYSCFFAEVGIVWFFLILLYLPFDKVTQNGCSVEDLHGFIYQFDGIFSFFPLVFFTFFYLFLTWFCLPFDPTEHGTNILT